MDYRTEGTKEFSPFQLALLITIALMLGLAGGLWMGHDVYGRPATMPGITDGAVVYKAIGCDEYLVIDAQGIGLIPNPLIDLRRVPDNKSDMALTSELVTDPTNCLSVDAEANSPPFGDLRAKDHEHYIMVAPDDKGPSFWLCTDSSCAEADPRDFRK